MRWGRHGVGKKVPQGKTEGRVQHKGKGKGKEKQGERQRERERATGKGVKHRDKESHRRN